MNCPKCGGSLEVYKTQIDRDYLEIDLICHKEEEHIFFARVREEDLIDAS